MATGDSGSLEIDGGALGEDEDVTGDDEGVAWVPASDARSFDKMDDNSEGGRVVGMTTLEVTTDVDDGSTDDVDVSPGSEDVGKVLGGMLDEEAPRSPKLIDDEKEAVDVNSDRSVGASLELGRLETAGELEALIVSLEKASRRRWGGGMGLRRPKGPSGLASTAAVAARRSKGSVLNML